LLIGPLFFLQILQKSRGSGTNDGGWAAVVNPLCNLLRTSTILLAHVPKVRRLCLFP